MEKKTTAIISGSIDLTAVDKSKLIEGKNGKKSRKEVQSKKLIEIDEDSPYYYKLSKTQKQISNLLNDYDNHVEDIRGNYLEVCKTKINFKDDYNMKILQYPNYKNTIKLNLMEEKKMPYGKYKGKDIDDLTDKQLEYAANDVIYLHKIKSELEKMLIREKRIDVFKKCLAFLDTRVELDQKGFREDIFEH